MTDERLLRLTATHEASHAVVCLATGGEVDVITVVPGEGYAGKMSPRLDNDEMKSMLDMMLPPGEPIVARKIAAEVRACARRQIVEYVAGPVGEWTFLPGLSSSTGDRHRRASHDLKLATAIARGISETEEAAATLLSAARVEARDILVANRPLVEAVAEALVRHGSLRGDEIELIIDGSMAT